MSSSPTPSQPLTRASMGITDGLPLEASSGDLGALRRDIQHLMDLEAIRPLKYGYYRCIDTANCDELATLFHDEVQVHFCGGTYEWKLKGEEEMMAVEKQACNRQLAARDYGI